MDKIMHNQGGLDEIYNPSMKCTPKTKQIFKLEKHHRNTVCCSDNCPSKEVEVGQMEDAVDPYFIPKTGDENFNQFGMNPDFNDNIRLFGPQTS